MRYGHLEVTFRHGRPLAAYLYLRRVNGEPCARTEKYRPGMLVDYSSDGRPLGIEFTSTDNIDLAAVNAVLTAAKELPATPADIAPLRVA